MSNSPNEQSSLGNLTLAEQERLEQSSNALTRGAAAELAIFTFTPDRRILGWNEGAERVFGYREEEVLGVPSDIIYTERDRLAGVPDIETAKAMADGKADDRRWHVRKDGSLFWGEGFVIGLRNEEGQIIGLTKIIRDETARLAGEVQLKRTSARLTLLADVTNDLLTIRDTQAIIGAIFSRIREGFEIDSYLYHQITEGDILEAVAYEGLPESAVAEVKEINIGEALCGKAAALRSPLVVDNVDIAGTKDVAFLKGTGTRAFAVFPLIVDGHLSGTLGFGTRQRTTLDPLDVEFLEVLSRYVALAQERLHAEAATRTSEQRFRTVAEIVPDLLFECDPQGRATWQNQSWIDYTGLSAEESLGDSWAQAVHPDDREQAWERFHAAVASGETLVNEHRLRSATGEYRWFLVRVKPLRDESQRITRWIGAITDIHEQRMQREELEQRVTERTAELVSKNAELEGFTYSVSHDMRAPLRAIVARARITLEEEQERLSDDGRENLERLAMAARKMAALVDDLLQYARIGVRQIQRERVDLGRLATEVAQSVAQDHPRCDLHFAAQESIVADCDPRLVGMAIHNLLDNACKYSKPHQPAVVEFGLEERETETVFFVRDNGIGFSPNYASKLFQPFERLHADEKYAGTGIGLANVRRVAERHGGRAWAESAGVDQGATFYFTHGNGN